MTLDGSQENTFLYELYTVTNGDPAQIASSQDIGATLGIDTDDAAEISQTLCIKGLAELKTLSGGIGITRQGLKALDITAAKDSNLALFTLGKDLVLNLESIEIVDLMLAEIKKAISENKQSYSQIEEMVIDLKTIEVQMLSPQPKTQVVREIFRSLKACIQKQGPDDLTEKLDALISS